MIRRILWQATTLADTIKRKLAVKKAIKQKSNYHHCIKPFTDAKMLLIQKQAYECMDELESRYNAIKVN